MIRLLFLLYWVRLPSKQSRPMQQSMPECIHLQVSIFTVTGFGNDTQSV